MVKYFKPILIVICFSFVLRAQVKVTSVEKIILPTTEQWSNAIFSPSEKEIYFTNSNYNGIWQFDLSTKLIKEITRDVLSGFEFSLSSDGKQIAYRRELKSENIRDRKQESVIRSVETLKENIVEKGSDIAVPKFVGNQVLSSQVSKRDVRSFSKSGSQNFVLGIDNAKIFVARNGIATIVDPFVNGQYIWPTLSPDGMHLAAVEMDHGAFVCDLEGKNIVRLGRCDAPNWTPDGEWIIGMDDRDDGNVIYASDIIAVSKDGKQKINLTENSNIVAMFPSCSLNDKKIVFSTPSGELYLLSYEVAK